MSTAFYEHEAVHAQRLAEWQAACRAVWEKPEAERTELEQAMSHWYYSGTLSLARECLEWEARREHGIQSRLRSRRSYKTWQKGQISGDETNFFQDARLALLVVWHSEMAKFVPMTEIQYLREYTESQTRHNNEEAERDIHAWEKWRPLATGAVLFRRGTEAELYQEVPNKRAYGGKTTRLRLAAEEWGPEKAILLQQPSFVAWQAHPGKSEVVVQLWEADRFVDAWQTDQLPPGGTATQTYALAHAGKFDADSLLLFRQCSGPLYALHTGETYIGPEDRESYATDIPLPNPIGEFTIDGAEFTQALKQAVRAASSDMTRPVLCCVFLEWEGGSLRMLTTDTYRLFIRELTPKSQSGNLPNVLLPRDFVTFVTDAMKKPLGDIVVRFGQKNEGGGDKMVEITGQTVVNKETKTLRFMSPEEYGQFVNWRKVVPLDQEHNIVVDAQIVTSALNELKDIAREDANRVVFQAQDGKLRLSASKPADHAWIEDTQEWLDIEAQTYEESVPYSPPHIDFAIAFNCRYVDDFLGKLKGPVQFSCDGPLNSAVWRYGTVTYILMPMQVV